MESVKYPDIMLDLETYGVSNDAAIASIGAVGFRVTVRGDNAALFEADSPEMLLETGQAFHARIDPVTSSSQGKVDIATVEWWLQQSDEARASLLEGHRISLGEALGRFSDWASKVRAERIWSNGPTFDETILRSAYLRYGDQFPIHYRGSRCCRTMFEMATKVAQWNPGPPNDIAIISGTLKHNALHDAVRQARSVVLQRAWISDRIAKRA